MEGDNIIALKRPERRGGRHRLARARRPVRAVGRAAQDRARGRRRDARASRARCSTVGAPLGIGFLGVGFSPNWTLDETPRMPKQRYQVMTRYMPMVGKRGLDMMYRTATIQVNLDFADEADMVKKFRVSLALQPMATAIFACSPFTEGKPNGFLSMRSEVWRDTDRDRTGMLPFVFEPGMSFERYVDYALACRCISSIATGATSTSPAPRSAISSPARLPQLPGELPTEDDWSDHLTTLFPEVRMKRFLEMRGADGGRWRRICALPALWTGLLYDADRARCGVGPGQGLERRGAPGACATRCRGRRLRTPFRRTTVLELARAGAGDRPGRPAAARLRECQGRGREHLPRARRGDPARRPHARRGDPGCATSATGAAAPIRCSASMPSERALRDWRATRTAAVAPQAARNLSLSAR